jgi:hypothetical protein
VESEGELTLSEDNLLISKEEMMQLVENLIKRIGPTTLHGVALLAVAALWFAPGAFAQYQYESEEWYDPGDWMDTNNWDYDYDYYDDGYYNSGYADNSYYDNDFGWNNEYGDDWDDDGGMGWDNEYGYGSDYTGYGYDDYNYDYDTWDYDNDSFGYYSDDWYSDDDWF